MIISILILTAIIIVTSVFLPWWIIVVVSFLYTALKTQNTLWKPLLVTFISGCFAYLIYSLISSIGLERDPAELIANLFGDLPSWSAYVVTSLIGGIAAAFGGVSGYLGGKILRESKT